METLKPEDIEMMTEAEIKYLKRKIRMRKYYYANKEKISLQKKEYYKSIRTVPEFEINLNED